MLNFLQALLKIALLLPLKIKDSASNFEHDIDNVTKILEELPLQQGPASSYLQRCKARDWILYQHDLQFLNYRNIHIYVTLVIKDIKSSFLLISTFLRWNHNVYIT